MDKKREQKGEFILSDEQEHGTKGGTHQFSLYRALHRGGIFTDIPGTTKEELIRNTMVHLAKHLELDADVLTELLIERENLQPTALNQGLAVPHTRDFLLSSRHDAVTIVFPETPIPYGALDGKPVHTLFFLFACSDKHHLNLLAKIAHLSSNPDAIALFNSRPNKEKVLAFIKDWEAHLKK